MQKQEITIWETKCYSDVLVVLIADTHHQLLRG